MSPDIRDTEHHVSGHAFSTPWYKEELTTTCLRTAHPVPPLEGHITFRWIWFTWISRLQQPSPDITRYPLRHPHLYQASPALPTTTTQLSIDVDVFGTYIVFHSAQCFPSRRKVQVKVTCERFKEQQYLPYHLKTIRLFGPNQSVLTIHKARGNQLGSPTDSDHRVSNMF